MSARALAIAAAGVTLIYLGATAVEEKPSAILNPQKPEIWTPAKPALIKRTLITFIRKKTTAAPFPGGNQSVADLYTLANTMAASAEEATPTAGGTLTVNSQAMGSYDYVIKDGNQIVSSFTNSNWFTATADSRSAFVVVKGNLTINSGQTFIPSNRKLFTVIYVTGDLSLSGGISMSARGANHSSATGSNVAAVAIRIHTGTFSSVTNPQVPAAGGGGGASRTSNGGVTAGTAGSSGGTGGGAGGAFDTNTGTGSSGAGAAGTCFGGGPGGGGYGKDSGTANATAGAADGGPGGNGVQSGARTSGGGGGNPGGTGPTSAGSDGTGGVLIIFVLGTLSGAGTVTAAGASGGTGVNGNGGGSGGGSVTIMHGTDSSSITPTAAGGASGGAAGTARKLAL